MLGRFPPQEAPRPAGEKTHHGDGDRTFAIAPGNMLDDHRVLHNTRITIRSYFPTNNDILQIPAHEVESPEKDTGHATRRYHSGAVRFD